MNIKERVENLEKSFHDLDSKKNNLNGQYQIILEQLKDLGCNSIEEAEKTIKETETNIEEEKKTLISEIERIEDQLGINK